MDSGLKVERTFDVELIKYIMTEPEIWEVVAEDGLKANDYMPDVNNHIWLLITDQDDVVAICKFNIHNRITVEMHGVVIPEHRSKHAREATICSLYWFIHNCPEYNKIIALVPEVHKNVVSFMRKLFTEEGRIKESYLKNNVVVDQVLFGITRDEIGDL